MNIFSLKLLTNKNNNAIIYIRDKKYFKKNNFKNISKMC